MNPLYPLVAARARHRCEYCRAPEVIFNFLLEVEHIIPLSRGGADALSNAALACRACNAHKAARLTAYDATTRRRVRLFHPRLDDWHEHFAADRINGAIVGLTDVSRANVESLRYNTAAQQNARAYWLRLGIFP